MGRGNGIGIAGEAFQRLFNVDSRRRADGFLSRDELSPKSNPSGLVKGYSMFIQSEDLGGGDGLGMVGTLRLALWAIRRRWYLR